MKHSSQDIELPKDFEIEDVETSRDDEAVVKAGEVGTWKDREEAAKVKWRPYITGIVVAIWTVCTLVGLFRWITLGDTLLLMSSPVLLLGPMGQVLKYYFRG
jgi:hypothetical protein